MAGSRFLFLSHFVQDESGERTSAGMTWMLVSPNNRPLGCASQFFPSYESCRESVQFLRDQHGRLTGMATAVEEKGRWAWRVDVDGQTVAVSSRTYLRQQECDYNLRRFLEAVPVARLVTLVRNVRSRRLPASGDSAPVG